MNDAPALMLVAAVAGVGVLHTLVPDHWVPITILARQHGWSRDETAWAALKAGSGHVVSTLLIALAVWLAGAAAAERFGHLVDAAASVALVAFGGWIALAAGWELRSSRPVQRHPHVHGHAHFGAHAHHHDEPVERVDAELAAGRPGDTALLTRHAHLHRHGGGPPHFHWHEHGTRSAHDIAAETEAAPPLHDHSHRMTARAALPLILGSSPMVEGIPAFFAASRYGAGLVAVMAIVFAGATIATYVLLCVVSTARLQRLRLGPVERYGEVMSGAFIAVIGLAFGLWPLL